MFDCPDLSVGCIPSREVNMASVSAFECMEMDEIAKYQGAPRRERVWHIQYALALCNLQIDICDYWEG